MTIELCVEPRVTKTWEQFCDNGENDAFSIALDGYVNDAPKYSEELKKANFNHHEGVDRLATRSTTGQVYVAIKQGLFHAFKNISGEATATLCVNDPDQDVATSVWLLQNHQRFMGNRSEPLITRLVSVVDLLDTTGGLYPLDPELDIRKQIAWIFEPYIEFRKSGTLQMLNAQEMAALVEVVGSRISEYTLGRGKKIPLDCRYEVLHRSQTYFPWVMIREIGTEARAKLVRDGIHMFVSVSERKDGRWQYTVAKTSQFIGFPIYAVMGILNEAEGIAKGSTDKWGGAGTIGGSPRQNGSKFPPQKIAKIIDWLFTDTFEKEDWESIIGA